MAWRKYGVVCLIVLIGLDCSIPLGFAQSPKRASLPDGVSVSLGSDTFQLVTQCLGVGFTSDSKQVVAISQQSVSSWVIESGASVTRWNFPRTSENARYHITADGRMLLVMQMAAEQFGTIERFELPTGKELPALKLGTGGKIRISEDGLYIFVEKSDETRIIRSETGGTVTTLSTISDIKRFQTSTDAKVFAILSYSGGVVVHQQGLPSWTLDPPMGGNYCALAVSADGKFLATAAYRTTDDDRKIALPIRIWNIAERRSILEAINTDWFGEFPHRMMFSPDARTVYAGDGGHIRGWSVATGKIVFRAEPNWGWTGNLQISPDGNYLAVCYGARPVVWDLRTGKQPNALRGHVGPVSEIAISPDGQLAATTSYARKEILLWNATSGQLLGELQAPFARSVPGASVIPGRLTINFDSNGQTLLSVNEASGTMGPLRIWDVKTQQLLREVASVERFKPQCGLTTAGLFRLTEGHAELLNLSTGKPLWRHATPKRTGECFISRDDRRVLAEDEPNHCVLWDAQTGRVLDRFDGEPLGLTADPNRYLVRQSPTEIVVRQVGVAPRVLPVAIPVTDDTSLVHAAGALLVEPATVDDRVGYRVWNLLTQQRISWCPMPIQDVEPQIFVPVNNDFARSLAVSSDGRRLAAVNERELLVWEICSGQILLNHTIEFGKPTMIRFSPNSERLFIAHAKNDLGTPVYGWDIVPEPNQPIIRAGKLTDQTIRQLDSFLGSMAPSAALAVDQFLKEPTTAFDYARAVVRPATHSEEQGYTLLIQNLSAAAYRDRASAMRNLRDAGWRAEAALREAVRATESVEAYERLSQLLVRPDYRPHRAIAILERLNTPASWKLIREIAAGKSSATTTQEAERALLRAPILP